LAFEQDASGVGWMNAVDQIEHGRFARPVWTYQADNLALVHGEIQALHRLQPAEALAQARNGEDRRHSIHRRMRGHCPCTKPSSPPGTNCTIASSSVPATTS